jgi:hypothetical protein
MGHSLLHGHVELSKHTSTVLHCQDIVLYTIVTEIYLSNLVLRLVCSIAICLSIVPPLSTQIVSFSGGYNFPRLALCRFGVSDHFLPHPELLRRSPTRLSLSGMLNQQNIKLARIAADLSRGRSDSISRDRAL